MYFKNWYKMLLFGFQDIEVKGNFTKWEALL